VITEESQKGADAIAFRQTQPNAMYDGHDWWYRDSNSDWIHA
jgi:hypothetical protein